MTTAYGTRFFIPGPPAGQGELRWYGPGQVVHPKRLLDWRQRALAVLTRHHAPTITRPYWMTVAAFFARPKSHLLASGAVNPRADHKIPRLDTDHLVRACGDVLALGGVVKDDVLCTSLTGEKRWADDEHPEGVLILIGEFE